MATYLVTAPTVALVMSYADSCDQANCYRWLRHQLRSTRRLGHPSPKQAQITSDDQSLTLGSSAITP